MHTIPDQSAVWVPLSDVMTWKRNPNRHPAHQVTAIRRAMEVAGWTHPVELARVKGHTQLIAYSGEGRLMAAKEGLRMNPSWSPKNPPDGYRPGLIRAVINEFDTIAEMEAQGIRANELARLSEMDRDGLSAIVSGMDEDLIDLTTLGFSERELADLTGSVEEVDEEDLFFSEAPEQTQTTPTQPSNAINSDPGSGILVQPGLLPPPFIGDGSMMESPRPPPPVIPAKTHTMGDLVFRVVIDVAGEAEQVALIERLESEGFKCKPLIS